jgi:hypothetical protein
MSLTAKKTKEEVQNALKEYPIIKTGLYVAIGVISLVVLGKMFKVLATSIREFKDFKSAINGN